MIFFAIKVKNKDLFWTSSDVLGEYISRTPQLIKTEKEAQQTLNEIDCLWCDISDDDFSQDELEVIKLTISY